MTTKWDKMRAVLSLSMKSLIVCVILLIASCATSINKLGGRKILSEQKEEYYKLFDKEYKVTGDLSKWEAQFQKIKEYTSLLQANNLELVSYKFDKKVRDRQELESVKCELAKDIAKNNFVGFQAIKAKNVMADFKLFLDRLLPISSQATRIGS